MEKSSILLRLRRTVRGFLFVPAMLAMLGLVFAPVAVWVDRTDVFTPAFDLVPFLTISASGARAVLGTIAGATMTVISLVYSLTLVVFTLAAGNIGPRLLETFSDNRVNQSTIGLLGGTFLYSLIVLYVVGETEVPRIAVAIAIILATISFFWVVYFVHDTAQRVMVDSEIGRTQRSLRAAIERLLDDEPHEAASDREALPTTPGRAVLSEKSGYVTTVQTHLLQSAARAGDGFVRMVARPGVFVVAKTPIAYLHDENDAIKPQVVRDAVYLEDVRAPDGDIQFNVHLNVEIALRALSPGINDPYTAISALDHLSASLAMVLQRGAPTSLIRDKNGTPRVWLEILDVKEIVGTALHSLRRGARGNVMVLLHLIAAIGRMAVVVRDEHAGVLHQHLRLIASDAAHSIGNRDDRREIAQALRKARVQTPGHSSLASADET
ncbi:DUF2254 domain-containing protein [Stappia sp. ES.058]|uniref:DUF2254 domain-containing protein n=1 Tax=Stappia sp. ES.058 TaxID=1881061 RepID=UPI00087A51F6|nr:DUF2254 domain-containing protein [Stappia sp. ES.058]SDU03831.1 Uncharacterized membrane protein [Stappia sp. ES.058]